jgi:thioredoxin reductase (NADPH)
VQDIVIIGAGPAGISMAVESRTAGVPAERVRVIERAHEHSFAIRKYYPETKVVTANYKGFEAVCTGTLCLADSTKAETLSYLDRAIRDFDVRVAYNEAVWRIHQDGKGRSFTVFTDKAEYDTRIVAVAIGILGKPNKPAYPLPASLKDRLLFEIVSTEIRDGRVLVVGGGDSASEYAQHLAHTGNDVTLSYRRTEFSRMNHINADGLRALGERGQVRLLLGSDVAAVRDAAGKPEVVFADGASETFDYVIYALGGSAPHDFLKAAGIEFDGPEPILKEGYETSVPGLFLLGDLSAGRKGGSIIWAFNSANTAMRRICERYLRDVATAPDGPA